MVSPRLLYTVGALSEAGGHAGALPILWDELLPGLRCPCTVTAWDRSQHLPGTHGYMRLGFPNFQEGVGLLLLRFLFFQAVLKVGAIWAEGYLSGRALA